MVRTVLVIFSYSVFVTMLYEDTTHLFTATPPLRNCFLFQAPLTLNKL